MHETMIVSFLHCSVLIRKISLNHIIVARLERANMYSVVSPVFEAWVSLSRVTLLKQVEGFLVQLVSSLYHR